MTPRPSPIARILVVDDSEEARFALVHYLAKSLECHVTSSASVDEAIEILDYEKFDCIITDFEMPPKTALDLSLHLQISGIITPFVVFTAHTNTEAVARKFPVKPNAIIQKMNPKELLPAILQIIETTEDQND